MKKDMTLICEKFFKKKNESANNRNNENDNDKKCANKLDHNKNHVTVDKLGKNKEDTGCWRFMYGKKIYKSDWTNHDLKINSSFERHARSPYHSKMTRTKQFRRSDIIPPSTTVQPLASSPTSGIETPVRQLVTTEASSIKSARSTPITSGIETPVQQLVTTEASSIKSAPSTPIQSLAGTPPSSINIPPPTSSIFRRNDPSRHTIHRKNNTEEYPNFLKGPTIHPEGVSNVKVKNSFNSNNIEDLPTINITSSPSSNTNGGLISGSPSASFVDPVFPPAVRMGIISSNGDGRYLVGRLREDKILEAAKLYVAQYKDLKAGTSFRGTTFVDLKLILRKEGFPTCVEKLKDILVNFYHAYDISKENMEKSLSAFRDFTTTERINHLNNSWSGKMRSNFSREQPVWLLGRCYHRKFSPTSSMENSAELTANLENKLTIDPPSLLQNQISPTQQPPQVYQLNQDQANYNGDDGNATTPEMGTDVIYIDQVTENAWEDEGIEGFKKDFNSRIWMTYRREFPIMNGSNYTSDCGWGCMLRSGQMMLAQALVCHFLGRSWRYDPETQIHSTHEDNLHRKIVRWFGDSSSKNCPFSIHTLVNLGTEAGKRPGDWYGPSSVSHLLKQAVKLASQEISDLDGLNVYVAQDCTVYLNDIADECEVPDPSTISIAPWQQSASKSTTSPTHQPNVNWKSLVLLVPLRLGTEKLNPIYANSLKALLSTEYCIGIIGGRPKHSLFFVGFQEDKLIHLDPHYCQEMVDVNQENFPMQSFHCKSPRKIKLSKMDPCCCIGFYCQTKKDFDNFVASVQPYLMPIRQSPQHSERSGSSSANNDINYPMFVFCRGRSSDQSREMSSLVYNPPQNQYTRQNYPYDDDEDDETEEFVII